MRLFSVFFSNKGVPHFTSSSSVLKHRGSLLKFFDLEKKMLEEFLQSFFSKQLFPKIFFVCVWFCGEENRFASFKGDIKGDICGTAERFFNKCENIFFRFRATFNGFFFF